MRQLVTLLVNELAPGDTFGGIIAADMFSVLVTEIIVSLPPNLDIYLQ